MSEEVVQTLYYPPSAEVSTLAALGALRQDVRALLAAVARIEWEMTHRAPQEASGGCNCHAKDWGEGSVEQL